MWDHFIRWLEASSPLWLVQCVWELWRLLWWFLPEAELRPTQLINCWSQSRSGSGNSLPESGQTWSSVSKLHKCIKKKRSENITNWPGSGSSVWVQGSGSFSQEALWGSPREPTRWVLCGSVRFTDTPIMMLVTAVSFISFLHQFMLEMFLLMQMKTRIRPWIWTGI